MKGNSRNRLKQQVHTCTCMFSLDCVATEALYECGYTHSDVPPKCMCVSYLVSDSYCSLVYVVL